ncbi:MAG: hypothetical protein EPN93_20240 [Spirochaetes bacterium]|nr:MAG: hypothetical protein EPN93_20240 [Spirochaetota bacterium]
MKLRNISVTALCLAVCVALLGLFSVVATVNAQDAAKDAPKDAKEVKAADKKEEAPKEVTGWRVKDFKPYIQAMQELQKLSKDYSENMLKLAIDEYSTGLDILEDMENEVTKLVTANKEKKNLNERWYWQEIDRKNQEERQVAKLKYDAKLKSVTYFTRAINHMDNVQFQEVRNNPKFQTFQSRLYQVYVSSQYDLYNFKPCIPILERYIALNEQNKKDVWAYKYLSSCYGYLETVVGKSSQAPEATQLQYKQFKNRYMLQAVEIEFGAESIEYKHLREIVEMDEKKSERLNDFK